MSQVVATAERVVRAPAERVLAALADYADTRRGSLPEQFSDYRGRGRAAQGAGTRVHWRFAATSKRVRDQLVAVTQPDRRTRLVETDAQLLDGHHLDGAPGRRRASHGAGAHHLERRRRHRRLLRAHLRAEGAAPRVRRDARAARRASSPPAERAARAPIRRGRWAGDRRAGRRPAAARRPLDALAELVADGDVVVLSGAGCPPTPASPTTGAPPAACAGTRR